LAVSLPACTGSSQDETAGDVADFTSLSADQEALSREIKAEADRAAKQSNGAANYSVPMAPATGARLELIERKTNESLADALEHAGASSRGGASIASYVDHLEFKAPPTVNAYVFVGAKSEPRGIVVHTIEQPHGCTFARVTAYDLEGTRLFMLGNAHCDEGDDGNER
jgi:hypothetical protein